MIEPSLFWPLLILGFSIGALAGTMSMIGAGVWVGRQAAKQYLKGPR